MNVTAVKQHNYVIKEFQFGNKSVEKGDRYSLEKDLIKLFCWRFDNLIQI